MELQIDPSKVYVCVLDDFPLYKDHIPKLVGVDLSEAISPQLIYVAEDIGGWVVSRNEYAKPLEAAIDTFYRHWQATKATKLNNHELWATNCVLNLPEYLKRAKPFTDLQYQKPKPKALVLGNGPSILREIEWLKQNWDKYTTISCWHVLPTLIANGLTPDYVAHIDGRLPVMGPLELLPLNHQIKLITIPPACNAFLKAFPDSPVYLNCDENKFVAQAVATALGFPVGIPCFGTVTYLQAMAAVELGCESITLIGVDLKHTTPNLDKAYKLYVDSLEQFYNHYCPDDIRLYNLSNGRKIEGFEDRYINGPDLAPSSTKCKPKRRTGRNSSQLLRH